VCSPIRVLPLVVDDDPQSFVSAIIIMDKRSMISDKSQARIESKKRKLQAFIDMIKAEDVNYQEADIVRVTDAAGDEEITAGTDQGEDEERIRQERKQRRIDYRNRPRIVLCGDGLLAKTDCADVKPVSLIEIQAAIIACLLPSNTLPFRPTICDVQRSNTASRVTIFVLKEDVPFDPDNSELVHFQHCIKFQVEENWVEKLLLVPVSGGQLRKLQDKGLDVKDAKEMDENTVPKEVGAKKMELMLSWEQMRSENFPLPDDEDQFQSSLDHYDPVTNDSPMFSLDCEMCRTTTGDLEVTRVTLVNEKEEVLIETFVKTKNPITDYLTEYSGVTAETLKDVTTELEDVHQMFKNVLPPDAILIGQSLETDLRKLRLRHPYVIDTSVIFNLSGTRQMKASLKFLAKKFLSQEIQSGFGHCSQEDAVAAMRLVQLKLEKGIRFGDAVIDPMRATWMKGKGHLVPLSQLINAKGIELKIFYDYSDPSVSRSMLILGAGSSAKQARQMIFETLSSSSGCITTTAAAAGDAAASSQQQQHSICIVLTSDGRCFLTCK
jgi:DNA polymerase III epsilon subunit-like protein